MLTAGEVLINFINRKWNLLYLSRRSRGVLDCDCDRILFVTPILCEYLPCERRGVILSGLSGWRSLLTFNTGPGDQRVTHLPTVSVSKFCLSDLQMDPRKVKRQHDLNYSCKELVGLNVSQEQLCGFSSVSVLLLSSASRETLTVSTTAGVSAVEQRAGPFRRPFNRSSAESETMRDWRAECCFNKSYWRLGRVEDCSGSFKGYSTWNRVVM